MKTDKVELVAKGTDERFAAEPGNAEYILNMRHDPMGYWQTSSGIYNGDDGAFSLDSAFVASSTTANVLSGHSFTQHNGARSWVVVENAVSTRSAKMRYIDFGAQLVDDFTPNYTLDEDASLDRNATFSPTSGTQYLANAGWLYVINGYEEPIRWDGFKYFRVGFEAPPPSPVVMGPKNGFVFADTLNIQAEVLNTSYAKGLSSHAVHDGDGGEAARVVYDTIYQKGVHVSANPYTSRQMFRSTAQSEDDANDGWEVSADLEVFDRQEEMIPWITIDNDTSDNIEPVGMDLYDAADRAYMYGYCITWVNDLGQESAPSNVAYVTGVSRLKNGESFESGLLGKTDGIPNTASGPSPRPASTKTCVHLTFPEAPRHVRGVRLYRSKNLWNRTLYEDDDEDVPLLHRPTEAQGRVFFHSEYGTGASLEIVDGKSDWELGSKIKRRQLGSFPKGVKYMKMFKGTAFAAASSEYPDRVFYSAPLFIDQWPEDNFLQVGNNDSGEVTGLHATKNALIVFKRRGIYLIKGDPVNGFFTQTLTEDIGCLSPNAILEVPGPVLQQLPAQSLGIMFLSDNGPYLLHGSLDATGTPTALQFMGGQIQNTWRKKADLSRMIAARAAINHEDHEVWVQIPTLGSSAIGDGMGLVFHYNIQQWSYRDYNVTTMFNGYHTRPRLYVARNTMLGAANAPLFGFYTHGAKTISTAKDVSSEYRTIFMDLKERMHVVHFQPQLLTNGREVDLNYRKDRRVPYVRKDQAGDDNPLTKDALDSEYTLEVWADGLAEKGTPRIPKAKWGTDKIFYDYTPASTRFDLGKANQRHLQVQLKGTKLALSSYEVMTAQRGTAKIKKRDVRE